MPKVNSFSLVSFFITHHTFIICDMWEFSYRARTCNPHVLNTIMEKNKPWKPMENTPFSSTLQFVTLNLFSKANTRNTERMKFQTLCFRYATQLANLSAPHQNGSQRGMWDCKTSHTRNRSWWKAAYSSSCATPPHSFLRAPWLSDLASSDAGCLSLTMPP